MRRPPGRAALRASGTSVEVESILALSVRGAVDLCTWPEAAACNTGGSMPVRAVWAINLETMR